MPEHMERFARRNVVYAHCSEGRRYNACGLVVVMWNLGPGRGKMAVSQGRTTMCYCLDRSS